jgi:hypothetical protein
MNDFRKYINLVLENSQDDYENPRIKKKKIPDDIGAARLKLW